MLKVILSLIMLMKFSKEWNLIQLSLLFLSFLFSLSCCHDFFMCELGYMFGMDYISFMMNMLSIWIMSLIIMSSQKIKKYNQFYSSFVITNLLLLLFLILTFSCLDYIFFYISFEMCLVPTLILIMGWGYQPERIQAGVYMLFYTLVFSLPLLGSLLMYFNNNGSLMMMLAESISKGYSISLVWYFCSVLAFMVKLPVYMFHLWLPKAHVEAPVAGSMILAGVLLKLGGYGLIRILTMFQSISKELNWIWVGLGLIGGTYTSLMCLRQIDMKSLIAYSSVAHMSLVLCGLMIFSYWGVSGAVIVMIGHGLCSSGLFCLANVVYERMNSRSLFIVKGLLNFMPSMGLWWFLLSVSNMASPPSLNLLGEISLIMSVLSWSKVSMVGVSTLSFFSAAYTLYMYSLSQHGLFFSSLYSCCSGKIREYLLMFLHWFPLNVLILNTNIMMI
uniref:NADH-ubiquinone oxidoreductase chain 4 n=1 Tax=Trapezia garthi TaxID=3073166 RepID=A0AA51RIM0_9EUCA|nr:NADH dehydrogenase subunit 4 [Trapezia garthi]WMQ53176.1 NADH dehydrogenase subunit 4 [Trapezia garthi]